MPYRRPRMAPPRADPPPPTMLAEQVEEFDAKEFGSRGELVAAQPVPAATVVETGLVIPAPDWDAERREWLERERLEEESE